LLHGKLDRSFFVDERCQVDAFILEGLSGFYLLLHLNDLAVRPIDLRVQRFENSDLFLLDFRSAGVNNNLAFASLASLVVFDLFSQ
jgi:hypothetical protein